MLKEINLYNVTVKTSAKISFGEQVSSSPITIHKVAAEDFAAAVKLAEQLGPITSASHLGTVCVEAPDHA